MEQLKPYWNVTYEIWNEDSIEVSGNPTIEVQTGNVDYWGTLDDLTNGCESGHNVLYLYQTLLKIGKPGWNKVHVGVQRLDILEFFIYIFDNLAALFWRPDLSSEKSEAWAKTTVKLEGLKPKLDLK